MGGMQTCGTAARACLLSAIASLSILSAARADVVTYDFENLSDSDVVTTQYAGLTFSHALVLTAGISLNEFEFPPTSGANVIFDDGGAITIDFQSPVVGVSGYFTYLTNLSFSAYDDNDVLLGTVFSSFGSNLVSSGDVGSSSALNNAGTRAVACFPGDCQWCELQD